MKVGFLESATAQGAKVAGIKEDPKVMGQKYGVRWLGDEERSHCQCCRTEFDAVTRRHHCRHCGDLFCQDCSGNQLTHVLTGTSERACKGSLTLTLALTLTLTLTLTPDPNPNPVKGCVKATQIKLATEIEIKSPRFLARLATVLVSMLAMLHGFPAHSARSILLGLLGMLLGAGFLVLRWQAIQVQMPDHTLLLQLGIMAGLKIRDPTQDPVPGQEGPSEHEELAGIAPLFVDGLMASICLLSSVTGLSFYLFLEAIAFGASAWYNYVEVAPTITRLLNLQPAYARVQTDSDQAPEGAL